MKKIISLMLLITLSFTLLLPVFAEVEDGKLELTVDEAVDLGLENNYTILAFDRQIDIAERYLRTAISKADRINVYDENDAVYLTNGKIKELYPTQREDELNDLLIDLDDMKQNLRLDITSQYMSLKNEMSSLEFMDKGVETLTLEYNSKMKEFELGLISSNALADVVNALKQAELNVTKKKWDIQLAHMELAKLVGVDLNTQFKLTDEIDYVKYLPSYAVELLAEQASETSDAIIAAEKDIEMKILEKRVVGKYTRFESPDGAEDYDKSIADLEKALEDLRLSEEIKVRSDYTGIKNADLDVQINEKKLELAQRELDVANIKYELGMFIKLDVVKLEDSLQNASNSLEASKLALYELVENFNYYIEDFTN